jgi:4-hydroxy-tetrahydrodipicolinate synthase
VLSEKIGGVVPIIPTPFKAADEAIDLEALSRLVRFAAAIDVPAVCLPAYASEFYKLSEAERFEIVGAAVAAADGDVAVVAQSNHPSAKQAAEIARRNADLGADLISFAMPRIFPMTSDDLLAYCRTICDAVELPVLIQDFNPGGPTVDGSFCARLREACSNFRYIKLEEPLMGEKVRQIREQTEDRIGVLEGWGGMYALELSPYGICGLMPGLAAADLLARVWQLDHDGASEAALDLFQVLLPQLLFSLQNMELFLHIEKRLLADRGLLNDPTVRSPTFTPTEQLLAYGDTLNRRLVQELDDCGLPRAPGH